MNKRTKLILSVIGIGALVIPVVLLIFLTERGGQVSEISTARRQLNTQTVEEVAKRTAPASQTPVPTPAPATPSASPQTTGNENAP